MRSFLAAAAMLAASNLFAMADPVAAPPATPTATEQPSAAPQKGTPEVQGCFSSPGNMTSFGSLQYNSESLCATTTCFKQNFPVAGTMDGGECYCGFQYPALDTLVDDSFCNKGCDGFGSVACMSTAKHPSAWLSLTF